ncbi:unnamed protein product [Ceratitis capitata]|uniref:(Mediterranean fruit fly) hypothetical protein n=1 Tax=Ceratitis capitata TaxID=7213 RepID=A0A811UPY9_CERCA|nr:unnamed protein product [Ceratitis capitata]
MQSGQTSQALPSQHLQNPLYYSELSQENLDTTTDKFDEVTYSIVSNAKRVVSSLLIHPENEPVIMEELEFNFGTPKLLIKVKMQKIYDFPSIYEGCLGKVVGLLNQWSRYDANMAPFPAVQTFTE